MKNTEKFTPLWEDETTMLRLRRKQQKATARLSNFINKQTREDSRATSARDEDRQLPFTPVTGV